MGTPTSTSAQANTEYLVYNLISGYDNGFAVNTNYFVRFVNGKVESYGKLGDFDSAKNPAVDINANVNSGGK